MSESNPLDDARHVHIADQIEAQMVALGRQYAALWRTLVEGQVPPAVAAELVHRQHAVNLQVWAHNQGG